MFGKRILKAGALFTVAGLAALIVPSVAEASSYTNASVQPSDPTTSAATTWTYTLSNASAATVKCLVVNFDTNAGFTTTSSAVVPTGNPGGTSLFTAGTWTTGPTVVASSSAYSWVSSGGMTSPGGSAKTFTLSVTNPATAETVYTKVSTFSDTGCTTAVDNGFTAAAITANTNITTVVDPVFQFTVSGQPASTGCNGVTSTVTTTGNTVPFGHINVGVQSMAVQRLNIVTNAANGYVVYLRSTASTAGVMKGTSTHILNDSGSVAVPSVGTSFFGYSTDSTTAAITSGNLKSVPLNTGNDVVGNGSATPSANNCVAYAEGAAATTPADSYSATVVYTAVPTF